MFVPVNAFARAGEFAPPPGAAAVAYSPHLATAGPPLVLAPQFAHGVATAPPLLDREPVDVCKLFVGGLSPATTDADLEEHFKQFGRVKSAVVMIDKKLNRSRCFGFVTFSTEKEAIKAYAADSHNIGGNEVELRRAVPRTTLPPPGVWTVGGPAGSGALLPGNRIPANRGAVDGARDSQPPEDPEDRECKVFIGGIPSSMTTDDIKAFFTKRFGMVKRVDFFYDRVTGRMRGFGFLVFSFPHSAEMAVGHHQIGDVTIEVKKAVERAEMRNQKAGGGGSSRAGRGFASRRGAAAASHLGAITPLIDFVPYEVAVPTGPGAAVARAPLQDPYSVSSMAQASQFGPAAASAYATSLDATAAAAAVQTVQTVQTQAPPGAALAAFPQPAVYVQPGAAYGYAVVPSATPEAFAAAAQNAASSSAAGNAKAATASDQGAGVGVGVGVGVGGAPANSAGLTAGADPYDVPGPVRASRPGPSKSQTASVRAHPY